MHGGRPMWQRVPALHLHDIEQRKYGRLPTSPQACILPLPIHHHHSLVLEQEEKQEKMMKRETMTRSLPPFRERYTYFFFNHKPRPKKGSLMIQVCDRGETRMQRIGLHTRPGSHTVCRLTRCRNQRMMLHTLHLPPLIYTLTETSL